MPGRRHARLGWSTACVVGVLVACALAAAGISAGARAEASADARSRPPVPQGLTALESSAEDLVDVALAHDRSRVVAMAGTLVANAGGAKASALQSAGAPHASVAAIREQATRVARLSHTGPYTAIALAANAVSELVVGVYAHFSDPVPVAVRELDYLDREAQLRSLAGQGKAVPPIVARLAATWASLRPSVVSHGGGTVAAAYGRHVKAMQHLAAGPGSPFRREAVNGLNIVDELEAVFSR